MIIDVRSEGGGGKLLFQWQPKTHTVRIVHKQTIYTVLLEGDGYKLVAKAPKGRDKAG